MSSTEYLCYFTFPMLPHVHSIFLSPFDVGKSKEEGSNNSFGIRRDIWNLLLSLSSLYALVLLEVSKQKNERKNFYVATFLSLTDLFFLQL
jgi:hypothetical protein